MSFPLTWVTVFRDSLRAVSRTKHLHENVTVGTIGKGRCSPISLSESLRGILQSLGALFCQKLCISSSTLNSPKFVFVCQVGNDAPIITGSLMGVVRYNSLHLLLKSYALKTSVFPNKEGHSGSQKITSTKGSQVSLYILSHQDWAFRG